MTDGFTFRPRTEVVEKEYVGSTRVALRELVIVPVGEDDNKSVTSFLHLPEVFKFNVDCYRGILLKFLGKGMTYKEAETLFEVEQRRLLGNAIVEVFPWMAPFFIVALDQRSHKVFKQVQDSQGHLVYSQMPYRAFFDCEGQQELVVGDDKVILPVKNIRLRFDGSGGLFELDKYIMPVTLETAQKLVARRFPDVTRLVATSREPVDGKIIPHLMERGYSPQEPKQRGGYKKPKGSPKQLSLFFT